MTNQVGLYEKKYPANWVVMQNRILQAFYEMTLDEKRLLLLASSVVRLIDATEKDTIEITAKAFAEACNIQVDSAYTQLKDASETMMRRFFSYMYSGSSDQYMKMAMCLYVLQMKCY